MHGDYERKVWAWQRQAQAEVNSAASWPALLAGSAILTVAGGLYEGAFSFAFFRSQFVQDDNTLNAWGALAVGALTVACPLVLAAGLHLGLRNLSPAARRVLDLGVAGASLVALFALPLLMVSVLGQGGGNPMDLHATVDPLAAVTHDLGTVMRLPFFGVAIFVTAFGIEGILHAFAQRRELARRRAELALAREAQAVIASATHLNRTRPTRLSRRRNDMRYGFARAMAMAVEARAGCLHAYARGDLAGGGTFADAMDQALAPGLSDLPPELTELVAAQMPVCIDLNALPVSPADLSAADRNAITEYAVWLRKTYTTTTILQSLET